MLRIPLPARALFLSAAAAITMPVAAQDKSAPAQSPAQAIDPKAIDALEKMGGYLRTLKDFEITATTTTEAVTEEGIKLQFGGNIDMKVRRPDHLRADISNDRKQRQLFYDGKSVTLYGPRVKYYATVSAPPTLNETIEVLAKKYGIETPLADLFYWGTDKAPVSDIKAAYYVGPATVNGTPAEQYAFRQDDVDWQVWIQKDNSPLPLKLVITDTTIPAQPMRSATLRWNVAPKLDNAAFSFKPPAGAMKIVLQTADGKVESAR